jgi:hypothetical protein
MEFRWLRVYSKQQIRFIVMKQFSNKYNYVFKNIIFILSRPAYIPDSNC